MNLSTKQLKALEHCVTQAMARMQPTAEMTPEQLAEQNTAWDDAYELRRTLRHELQRKERELSTFGNNL